MIKTLNIANFKCFESISVSNLNEVNLIAGLNNVGKTALLEAIFLFSGVYNPGLTLKLYSFRGVDKIRFERGASTVTPWDYLFHNFDVSRQITLTGSHDTLGEISVSLRELASNEDLSNLGEFSINGGNGDKVHSVSAISTGTSRVLEQQFTIESKNETGKYHLIMDEQGLRTEILPQPPFPGAFLSTRHRINHLEDSDRWGKLETVRKDDIIFNALKFLEPRLNKISIIPLGGESTLHGDIGLTKMLPLSFMGEGISRLVSFLLAIGNTPNGVVLIDEIENGFHHSILKNVIKALASVAKDFNVQLFLTTHSFEFIKSAFKEFMSEEQYRLNFMRLERVKDEIEIKYLDKESLDVLVNEGFELR